MKRYYLCLFLLCLLHSAGLSLPLREAADMRMGFHHCSLRHPGGEPGTSPVAFDTVIVWENISIPFDVGPATAIAVDRDGNLLVGTFGGTFRSTDNGSTWKLVGDSLGQAVVTTFGMAPNGMIFAGTNDGVFRSTDKGLTWGRMLTSLEGVFIHQLAINSRGVIFAGADEGIVYRSENDGNNWSLISDWGRFSNIQDLRISKSGDVYVLLSRLIWYSTDDGQSWDANGFIPEELAMSALAIDSTEQLFVSSIWELSGNGGVFRSQNSGGEWFPAGLYGTAGLSIALDRRGRLLTGTVNNGLFRSTDQGGHWTELHFPGHYVSKLAFGYNDQIYAIAGDSIYRSSFVLSGVNDPDDSRASTRLIAASPNPLNDVTSIRFQVETRRHVRVTLYDAQGGEVVGLVDEVLEAGEHEARLDARSLPVGVYHCRLVAGGVTSAMSVVIVR